MSEPQELIAQPKGFVKEATVKLTDFLGRYRSQIIQILPKHLTPERVLKLIVGELNRSPNLMNCTPMSVVNCCLHAASIGVEIRPRSAYIVAFGKEASLLLDYRAKIDLALRSGLVEDMEARIAYKGDDLNVQFGTDPKMVHVPKFESDEPMIVYAVAWMKGSPRPHVEIMTVKQVEGIRAKSRMANGPAWANNWDQMARKTIIHRIANYLPQSPEMAHSQDLDDSLDSGKPMASFLETIEPADDQKPLIEASPEEQERVMQEKLSEAHDAQAAKKAERKARKEQDAHVQPPVDVEPAGPVQRSLEPCKCTDANCFVMEGQPVPQGRFCREGRRG